MDFVVLWLFVKVFSAKFVGMAFVDTAKESNTRMFCLRKLYFSTNSQKFSLSKVSRYMVILYIYNCYIYCPHVLISFTFYDVLCRNTTIRAEWRQPRHCGSFGPTARNKRTCGAPSVNSRALRGQSVGSKERETTCVKFYRHHHSFNAASSCTFLPPLLDLSFSSLVSFLLSSPLSPPLSLLSFPFLPDRFTEFLSGKDHVTMEERVDHDWSFVVTDSESDTVDYSDDEGNSPPASHR